MIEGLFKWFDAHNLTSEEVADFNYLSDLLCNFEEEFGEFEEDEAVKLIFDYQIYFRKKVASRETK